MTCSATRFIIIAWAVGLLTMTLTGSEGAGWLAAGMVVAVASLLGRKRPARACETIERTPEPLDEDAVAPR